MIDTTALNGATIAFDLDGTLVESAPDLIGAVNAILIAEGFEPWRTTRVAPSSAVVPAGCCNGVLRSPESKKQTPVLLPFSAASSAIIAPISQTRACRFQG